MNNPFYKNINPFLVKNSNEFFSMINAKKMVWVVSERTLGKTTSVKNILDKNKKKYVYQNCNYHHNVDSFLKSLLLTFANEFIIKKDLSELANVISTLKESFEEVKINLNIDNENAKVNIQSVEFKDIKKAMDEIFNVVGKISKENDVTIVLDEFDSLFLVENKKKNELDLLKEVLPKKVSIVFIGSNRDLMQEYFTSNEMQKHGVEFFKTEEILETHWRMHLNEIFKSKLKKNIPQEILNFIMEISNLNPHYVNVLSGIVYDMMAINEEFTKEDVLNKAFAMNSKFFKEIVDSMSLNQKKAIILIAHTEGVNVYKSENLKKINLSKSSMERCITSFLTQRIILKNGMNIRIKDPLLEKWIKTNFIL